MIKLWYGPEMEGEYLGGQTLFVCSDEKVDANLILPYLADSSLGISRVYLGAGRVEFHGFLSDEQIDEFINVCLQNSVHVVLETCSTDLSLVYHMLNLLDMEVILTVRDSNISDTINIHLKIDNNKVARVFDNKLFFDTDIRGIVDTYTCDVVILDSERSYNE